MAYKSTALRPSVTIRKIISVHYFEYMSDFTFAGESHDFWELVCIDKGLIDIISGKKQFPLKRGNIFFHKPGEFHNILTREHISPSLVVIGFECSSPCMNMFGDKVLSVQETEIALLARIIAEARNAFSGRLDNPYQEALVRRQPCTSFGAEQLMENYLEELIIHLYRKYFSEPRQLSGRQETESGEQAEAYSRIVRYMEEHLGEHLNLETICHDNLTGRSQLQKLFRKAHGCGVMEYFSGMKIEAAKQLIRSGRFNFTEISDRLGYSSIHYFSRQFKKLTGMTPSEYEASIRALSEKP